MSTTALSNTQTIIERSIFERIRLELVDKGYLPDIAIFANDQSGYAAYQAAVTAIANGAKGFAIELFSEGANDNKGIKKVPRIVMNTGSFLPGALGGDPQKIFTANGSGFSSHITPPQTVDFFINFHLVADDVAQERILNAILALAIPRRGYIPWYTDSTKTFFIRYINYFDADNLGEGMIEKVYAYEIPDAWDSENILVDATVAKTVEITLQPNVQAYMDRTWGYDTDPLVLLAPN